LQLIKLRYASGTNLVETSVLITNVQTDTTSVFTEQSILNSTEGKIVTKVEEEQLVVYWCIAWKFEFWNRSWCDKCLQMWQATRVW